VVLSVVAGTFRLIDGPWYGSSGEPDELFLITGSCQTLEISLKNRNANERLHGAPGQRITIS